MWLSLVCACACVAMIQAAPLPEGLRYVGIGYNLLRANPDGNFWSAGGDDPGLLSTRKILTLSADDVPTEIVYEFHDTCRKSNQFSLFYDSQSYQNKLLESIRSSGTNNDALVAVAFTLSAGYEAIHRQTLQDYYVFQDETSICSSGQARYKWSLSQGNHYGLNDEFASAVCALPLAYDAQVYEEFLDTWGTHVTTGVETGSKIIKRYLTPSTKYVEFLYYNSSNDVSLAVLNGASTLVVDVDSLRYRSQYRHVIGYLEDTFIVGTDTSPEPIGFDLVVVSDLLDPSHWQNIDDYKSRGLCPQSTEAALAYIRNNLEQAIVEYPNRTGAAVPTTMDLSIPVTWPMGTYALPKPKSGCPSGDFTWYEGWRLQDTESQSPDNAWSTNNHFAGSLDASQYQLEFCTKGQKNPTAFDRNWPKGDYCIFKYGDCPIGFEEGYVKWDDEDSLNKNDWQGVLPDGVYDEDTIQRYCCRDDGLPTEPIILPTYKSFYLFQYKRDVCQKVANMQVEEEWLRFDDEDFKTPSNSELGTVHPGMEFWNEPTGASGSQIYYCYYSPQL